MSIERVFVVAASVVVVVGVGVAFFVIGPPGYARLVALDRRRVEDLGTIASELNDRYGKATAKLPKRLPNDLASSYFTRVYTASDSDVNPENFTADPVTNRPYAYRRLDARHYKLCAIFARPDELHHRSDAQAVPYYWNHGAGPTCYAFDVSKAPPEPHIVAAGSPD